MKSRKIFPWILVVGFLSIAILIFRPVPQTTADNAVFVTGIVNNIHEGGGKDIVFKLQGKTQTYYINRGLEQGLILADLKAKLIGQEVEVVFPQYWTPLDWNNHVRHLSRLRLGEEVIFDETRGRQLSAK